MESLLTSSDAHNVFKCSPFSRPVPDEHEHRKGAGSNPHEVIKFLLFT
jgi:hypothetical protein